MPLPHAPFLSAVLATVVLALTSACGPSAAEATDLSQADLEQQVSSRYEPDDPQDTLTATCEGDLQAEDDATQDCTVTTGGKEVGVRAQVTDVGADDLGLETTPFLPPEMVADAITSSLEIQGIEKVETTCDGDLMGEVGDAVTCIVTTPDGDTEVNVDVTSIDGLLINFDFKSA